MIRTPVTGCKRENGSLSVESVMLKFNLRKFYPEN